MKRGSTYGGFGTLVTRMQARRAPLRLDEGEDLPPQDLDLVPLRSQRCILPPEGPASAHGRKARELAREFEGRPRLLWLHALLIAHLRRSDQPPQTAPLFQRLWAEEGTFLIEHLSPRWLISAMTTFGDHGTTEAQRRTGTALNVLFGTMKLYESERLLTGLAPDVPFGPDDRLRCRLPLDMAPYALKGGGLDVNMLGRLWQEAGADPVTAPLARHLLELLDAEPRGIFRRLCFMRAEARSTAPFRPLEVPADQRPVTAPTKPGAPDWGVVATLDAPLPQLLDFATHHLSLGAARLMLYLDPPDPVAGQILARDARVQVVQCDQAHWQDLGVARPELPARRQARNATHAYHRAQDLHWLAHLDGTERLLPRGSLTEFLAEVPQRITVLDIAPAERLGRGQAWRLPLSQNDEVPEAGQVYPTFGPHLEDGLVLGPSGRPMVRTGIAGCRLGLHFLIAKGRPVPNRARPTVLWLGRALPPDWDSFRSGLSAMLQSGHYPQGQGRFAVGDVLSYLAEEEGEAALRLFWEETCADSPALRARLDEAGLLLLTSLHEDAAVRAGFGPLPDSAG